MRILADRKDMKTAIVIGGGHNGLMLPSILRKAGREADRAGGT